MKVRITGSAAECDRLLVRLAQVVQVREVSGFYPNRAPSALGRVYLDVDLVELPGPTVRADAVRAGAVRAGAVRAGAVRADAVRAGAVRTAPGRLSPPPCCRVVSGDE